MAEKELKSYRELSLLWSLSAKAKKLLVMGLSSTILGVIAVENVSQRITILSFITNSLLMCIFLVTPFILIMVLRNLIAKISGYFYIFIPTISWLGGFGLAWWDVMYSPKEKQPTFLGRDPRKKYWFKKSKKHHLALQSLIGWLSIVTITISWAFVASKIIPPFFK